MAEPLSLQSFLDALNRDLHVLTAEALRQALLQYASSLPGSERPAFLAAFESPVPQPDRPQATRANAPVDLTWPVDHNPLLDDIDTFVASIEDGEYFDGYGWDHEAYEERSFGDESWTQEFDDLLARSGEAFLAGRLGLARAAYERLLGAFALDEEVGTFSGPLSAVDMVDKDLSEVKAATSAVSTRRRRQRTGHPRSPRHGSAFRARVPTSVSPRSGRPGRRTCRSSRSSWLSGSPS